VTSEAHWSHSSLIEWWGVGRQRNFQGVLKGCAWGGGGIWGYTGSALQGVAGTGVRKGGEVVVAHRKHSGLGTYAMKPLSVHPKV